MTRRVVRSWRHLKNASIAPERGRVLKLTWHIESIVEEPGLPVFGGGDRGLVESRQNSETVEHVPWSDELYETVNRNEGRLLTGEQVDAILKR